MAKALKGTHAHPGRLSRTDFAEKQNLHVNAIPTIAMQRSAARILRKQSCLTFRK
jgi:hypothetical protein